MEINPFQQRIRHYKLLQSIYFAYDVGIISSIQIDPVLYLFFIQIESVLYLCFMLVIHTPLPIRLHALKPGV